MQNKKIIIPLAIIITACVSTLGFIGYKNFSYNNMITNNEYPDNTKITIGDWSMYATGKTSSDIYNAYLEENNKETVLKIVIKGKEYTLDLTDNFKTSITKEDFDKIVSQITFQEYLSGDNLEFELEDNYVYDQDKLNTTLFNFLENTEYKYEKSKDAYLDKETYTIVEEVNGTKIDNNKAILFIKEKMEAGETTINLDNKELYENATVTKQDLEEEYAELLEIANWSASYSVTDYVINMKDYMDYVTKNDDGTYSIDTSFMKKAVLALSKTVDKAGGSIKFKSTLDGEITVKGGTYGQVMDNKKEIEFLIDKLEKKEKVENRTPIWKVPPKEEGHTNTYVEVDLSAQHVWYYENGKLVMDTGCVTGTDNTSRETPTGAYFISEKVNGKYLTGATWRTWVDKWMRLTNDGVGLHDAQWRSNSEFGGKTYKYDGSHGCINLPKDFAYKLYDKVKVGTFVVVHE